MDMDKDRKNYLLLLHNPSAEAARHAWRLCRELNIPVNAQYGNTGLEISATPDEAERLFGYGLFAVQTARAISDEHIEKLTPAAQEIAAVWNQQFSPEYRKRKKDKSKRGLKYNSPGKKEPAPYVDVDPEEFRRRLMEQIRERKIDPAKVKPAIKIDPKRFGPEDYLRMKKYLEERLQNEKLAYRLSKLLYRLRDERQMILSPEILDIAVSVYQAMDAEESCWKMHGRICIGLVFVESSKTNGPKFSNTARNEIINEVKAGLSWLVSQHPAGDLVWIYDIQKVKIDVAGKANLEDSDISYDAYWRNPGMGKVVFGGNTYAANDTAIDEYRDDMLTEHGADHATVIFITPYGSSWHAYSSGKRFIAMSEHGDDWGNWGQDELNITTAHEMCHKFGAADEYSGSGTPCDSCGGEHGCDNIPNGNCESCAEPAQGCIMEGHDLRLCAYTRGQIGWSDIFVELWTEDEWYAGTDDDVWLDIGDRTFVLDTPGHNDRERGNREGHAIWDGGNMPLSSIKRILIRKSGDGVAGGWKLRRVRVFHGGEVICDQSPHQWLEDDRRWWLGCVFDNRLMNKLKIKVTTADVAWAGTDDTVTLKLAGRSWNLDNDGNDFERGDTNTFTLDPKSGIRVSDINTITIIKSSDGVAGGWKLKGLQLTINDSVVYNNQSINKWLEDDHRVFTDGI